jgi:hypothetical protein
LVWTMKITKIEFAPTESLYFSFASSAHTLFGC